MTILDVESTLNNTLQSFRAEYPIDVQYSNTDYTPVVGVPYLKVDLVSATTNSVGVGQNTKNREVGFYQIDIVVPSLSGKATVKQYLDGLQKYFKRGSSLVFNGVGVRVLRFRSVQEVSEAVWFRHTVRVEYRSDIEN